MATVVIYDSGSTPLPANEWGGFFLASELPAGDRPVEVGLSIVPVSGPKDGWNLAGWACIEHERESFRWCCPMTAVGLLPQNTSLPYTALAADGVTRATGRIQGFRGVRWNIHRWVGPCRVRVVRFT